MPLTVGTHVGPYEVLALLGAGGMGEVYRARDTRLGREVAVKVLPGDVAADAGRRERFEQEARAASSLNHPNILTVHDIGEVNGSVYIAMELVEGKTLRELAAGEPLPPRKLLEIGVQIADGLAKAHAIGIVHRDLKPENLMVSKDGFVKILDFGLAKLVEPESQHLSVVPTAVAPPTQPGTILGTVGYMSPEQASGQPLDFRSDQFALGSILYEMASGRRAFQRKTVAETLTAIIREEPEPLAQIAPTIPPPLRWIIERCLAKDREDRYVSTRDLARDLASVRDHLSETSVSGGTATVGPVPRKRRGWLAAAALVLGAALAGGILLGRGPLRRNASAPIFQKLTFRRGHVGSAFFTPDGQTVVYGAAWDGAPVQAYSTRIGTPESAPLSSPAAEVLSISSSGELALLLGRKIPNPGLGFGRLARVPLTGGAPRELLDNVLEASWTTDGQRLLIVRQAGDKCRLELGAGNVLYETSGWIEDARESPGGGQVAFIEHPMHGGWIGTVCVISTSGGKKRSITQQFDYVQGLAWGPGGREIWFSGGVLFTTTSEVFAVTPGGRQRLVLRAPVNLRLHDLDSRGRALIAAEQVRYSLIYGSHELAGEREMSAFNWSNGTLSSDGQHVLIEEAGEGAGRVRTYLRQVDGSPAVRLGEGLFGSELSPDGRWVVAYTGDDPQRLELLPVGPGEARTLPATGLTYRWLGWFPDGQRIAFSAFAPGHKARLYSLNLAGGSPVPFTEEIGGGDFVLSADGEWVLTSSRLGSLLWPTKGGKPVPLSGLELGDNPLRFSPDGRSLFITRSGISSAEIIKMELKTATRSSWQVVRPGDGTGVWGVYPSSVTPDGGHYLYSYHRVLSELFLVDGLQ